MVELWSPPTTGLPFSGLTSPQTLSKVRFTSSRPGVCLMREASDIPEREIKILRDNTWKPSPHQLPTIRDLVPVAFGSTADTVQYLRSNSLLGSAPTCSRYVKGLVIKLVGGLVITWVAFFKLYGSDELLGKEEPVRWCDMGLSKV